MGFNCGIVGLPNVGKSTLFNALTATQAAEAANYPFCTIDPIRDAEVVETELMIADLDSLEKRAAAAVKKARGNDKEAKAFLDVAEPALELLREGKPARALSLSAEQKPILKSMQLLSAKP